MQYNIVITLTINCEMVMGWFYLFSVCY